jgi:hypothetical protein
MFLIRQSERQPPSDCGWVADQPQQGPPGRVVWDCSSDPERASFPRLAFPIFYH